MDIDQIMRFLDFVQGRHSIWEKRQAGKPQPWTGDPILASKKFTNVYRVLDPGSQFVFKLKSNVVSERDLLMRLFLYRYSNRPSAWQAYFYQHGGYPKVDDLDRLEAVWAGMRDRGEQVFSGAYMILPAPGKTGDKVNQVINLTKRLFTRGSPDDVVPDFLKARSQAERHTVLTRNYGVGDFMAMQILTDWGYLLDEDRENGFIVGGPGSTKGARLVFPGGDVIGAIEWARHALSGVSLYGRSPSLMDAQNCFCEFYKYDRWSKVTTEMRQYRPAHPGPQPEPLLPSWWRTT